MDLSDEQKAQVKDWVATGESLSGIQQRLDEEFGIKMTYMETRFLVEDLEVDLQDQESGTHKDEAAEATSDAVEAASEGAVDLEDAGFDGAAGPGKSASRSTTSPGRAPWSAGVSPSPTANAPSGCSTRWAASSCSPPPKATSPARKMCRPSRPPSKTSCGARVSKDGKCPPTASPQGSCLDSATSPADSFRLPCGYSLMVKPQPSKLVLSVRSRLPAPFGKSRRSRYC